MELTQARVRELFDYRDGQIFWRRKPNRNIRVGSSAGTLRKDGRWAVGVDGQIVALHRVVFLWHHGWLPAAVDHIDMDQSNNRIENLRAATNAQNLCNRGKTRANQSGLKGVSLNAKGTRWRAFIGVGGRTIYIGTFDTPEAASAAYQQRARQLHGEFARF